MANPTIRISCLCFLVFQALTQSAVGQYQNSKSFPRIFYPITSEGQGRGLSFQVGDCTLDEYFADVHVCQKRFYKSVLHRELTPQQCSDEYKALKSCVMSKLDECLKESWLLDILVWSRQLQAVYANMLALLGDRTTWCVNGGVEAPQYVQEGVTCSQPQYSRLAQACVAPYQHNFRRKTSSLWQLCRDYASAKVCLRRTHVYHCTCPLKHVNQMIDVISKTQLSFLPFCNRRPTETYPSRHLHTGGECPPWFGSDIVMVADTRDGEGSVREAKEAARCLIDKFNLGPNGIRLGFVQFNSHSVVVSIGLHQYKTKPQMLTAFEQIKPIPAVGISQQTTTSPSGEALKFVQELIAGEQANDVEESFYPPVVVMFSGRREQASLPTDSEKKTIVITVEDGDDEVSGSPADESSEIAQRCSAFTNKICFECRTFGRNLTQSSPIEHHDEDPSTSSSTSSTNPILQLLYRKTERLGFAYLPLLWTPVRITSSSGGSGPRYPSKQQRVQQQASLKIGEN